MTISCLEKRIDFISKILTVAFKLGIFLGGGCIISYFLRIGYIPQDLSIGDGLLFLMAAVCFGLLYGLVIAMFASLGIVLYILFQLTLNKLCKSEAAPLIFPSYFLWTTVPLTGLAVLLIYILDLKDKALYFEMPGLSFMLFLLCAFYAYCENKIKKSERDKTFNLPAWENGKLPQQDKPELLRKFQLLISAAIIFAPLIFFRSVTGLILDMSMKKANIRIESSSIYIKNPHALLIPKTLVSTKMDTLTDYTAFEKVTVLFNGFGKTTVVSFDNGKGTRQLEIPNDQLIIVKSR